MTSENALPILKSNALARPGLADDMLRGAAEIAEFLFGDRQQRRKVYHLAATTRFPCFRIGAQLHARKSVLLQWIADQERRGLHPTGLDTDQRS